MKQFLRYLILFFLLTNLATAQNAKTFSQEEAFRLIEKVEKVSFQRTTNPAAQWFPQAGFGLFIHWGIHSVIAADPSWSMLKNCPWLKEDRIVSHEKYYNLANEFNPQNFDPEKWALAAKNAGFQYIVVTTKHHDGYCLWPTNFGKYNTKTYLDGRDLLQPFVDACRNYGLRIGFYFSPRDWSHPDYPMAVKDFDFDQKITGNRYSDGVNQQKFDLFFQYTIGQLSEILTRYGKIDVLWFDGIDWPGVDTYSEKLHAWLRAIQPEMVINPRWETNDEKKTFGDFRTEEIQWRKHMETRPYEPGTWWEFNETWSGHWGYSPMAKYRDFDKVIAALVYARSYGGNYLPDIGPAPDGTMRPGFYEQCNKLSEWMAENKESVIGTSAFDNWQASSNVPLTKGENCIYAHLLKGQNVGISIKSDLKPIEAILLTNGQKLAFEYRKSEISIRLADSLRGLADDVVKIIFNTNPALTIESSIQQKSKAVTETKAPDSGKSSGRIIDGREWVPFVDGISGDALFEIVGGPDTPVVEEGMPGTEANRGGFEGGTLVKVNGTYHIFPTERAGEPNMPISHDRVKTNIGHWTSSDAIHWTRQSPILESTGVYALVHEDNPMNDRRSAIWSFNVVFNEEKNKWYGYYLAYTTDKEIEPNHSFGRIWRCESVVEGIEGIGGPYRDKGIIMEPGLDTQLWEGRQGVASFYPFKVGNGWHAFISGAYPFETKADYPLRGGAKTKAWYVGLARSETMEGPWTRMGEDINPVTSINPKFVENPIVSKLPNGLYIAMFDGGPEYLQLPNKIGYTLSKDGVNWSEARYLPIDLKVKKWWMTMRTPLGLIPEGDNIFTIVYTAWVKDPNKPNTKTRFNPMGMVKVKLNPEVLKKLEDELFPNAPQSVNGRASRKD
jgi:alpha-L-fucosidase